MKINISFSDLIHTEHSAKVVPCGIALVASYALKMLGDKVKINLFKSTDDFINYIEQTIPKIACFSNYIWNTNLSSEFARQIKTKSPETIIIFGGPNYPLDSEEQKEFLLAHPEIDFYIEKEGEQAFVELFNTLLEYDFDITKLKKLCLKISNCHYIHEENLIIGKLLPRMEHLDDIPSPYLTGLCDRFLEQGLTPLMETVRGCPFTCTYCQEGSDYFSKIKRFSIQRAKDEIEYISQRAKAPTLQFSDSNFGMYREDLEICEHIAFVQKKYNWPKVVSGISGKNQKEIVIKAASLVNGAYLCAAVQSTDKQVLQNIKRANVSIEQMIDVAKAGEALGINSFSEVILCLPGDTKKAHFQSIAELIDAGIDIVRSHQFIMLPGSEAATKTNQKRYGMSTRFRVNPNTVVRYQLFGNTFFAPEIDEICVANNTLTFEDYLDCRLFNLTVEIFYNNGIFRELINYLKSNNIQISLFVNNIFQHISQQMNLNFQQINLTDPQIDQNLFHPKQNIPNYPNQEHEHSQKNQDQLSKIYAGFLRETNEIWNILEELEHFLQQPGIIERYLAKELGNNEQLVYQALALFNCMDELHQVAFAVAAQMLAEKNVLNEQNKLFISELAEFNLAKKNKVLTVNTAQTKQFHFDFINLTSTKCNDPSAYYKPEGINLQFQHTAEQKRIIDKMSKNNGFSEYGRGNLLTNSSHVSNFYRKAEIKLDDFNKKNNNQNKNSEQNNNNLLKLFEKMLYIRLVEEKICELYPEQEMRCPIHLCIGQEAIAVGICSALTKDDLVFSNHRSHGHYLAKEGDLKKFFAEIYGKSTGCSHGLGGSQHLVDLAVNFIGSTPIVGGTIPLAVGAAFSLSYKNANNVAVVFLGDGASEEGVFHESLNFAKLKNLPVLFVCENNLYSVYTHLHLRQPKSRPILNLAQAHGLDSYIVDGNNVAEVYETAQKTIEKIKQGNGPALIEAPTYRWREHCGPNYDNHIGYRTEEEFLAWKEKDPLKLAKETLLQENSIFAFIIQNIESKIKAEIEKAVEFAKSSNFPTKEQLSKNVYAK